MKITTIVFLSAASLAVAQKGAGGTPVEGGLATGPYKSGYYEDPAFPKHTIFAPVNPPPNLKMPVLIWGNGGCSGNGTLFKRSLWEMASYGIFAVAMGSISGGDMTSNLGKVEAPLQKSALERVDQNAGKGKYANVDKTRIAAAGQSCGGLETLAIWSDPRVQFLGIFNSGELNQATIAPKVNKPIFYFLGGSSDIAYANGERDYKSLPGSTPRWKGNLPVGHMATWSQTNSGKFGKAERMWLTWVLRGEQASSDFFLKGGAKADGWDIVSAGLENMPEITLIGKMSAPAAPAAAAEA